MPGVLSKRPPALFLHRTEILMVSDSTLALDQIYNEAPVGLCAFDTDVRYRSINAWLAALKGIPVEDHLGRTVGEVLPDLASHIEPQLQGGRATPSRRTNAPSGG